MKLKTQQRDMLRRVWREGRLSRWELHEQTGLTPNAVGVEAAALIRNGLLREAAPQSVGPGRPRVPLEIDPSARHVVGLSVSPGRFEVGRLNLRGALVGKALSRSLQPGRFDAAVRDVLSRMIDDRTVAVGLSVPGFIDPATRTMLFSSVAPGGSPMRLDAVYQAAGELPVIFENDLHALGARWMLTHQADREDVMLVYLADGRVGATMMIDGRPNRGCIIGANELGHTRFIIDTDPCYCGNVGCVERICSSAFLRRHGKDKSADLESAVLQYNPARQDPGMELLLQHLATALSNTINFVRPHRFIIASSFVRSPAFCDALLRRVRAGILRELLLRLRVDVWDEHDALSAETAGWLALASLFREGWLQPNEGF